MPHRQCVGVLNNNLGASVGRSAEVSPPTRTMRKEPGTIGPFIVSVFHPKPPVSVFISREVELLSSL